MFPASPWRSQEYLDGTGLLEEVETADWTDQTLPSWRHSVWVRMPNVGYLFFKRKTDPTEKPSEQVEGWSWIEKILHFRGGRLVSLVLDQGDLEAGSTRMTLQDEKVQVNRSSWNKSWKQTWKNTWRNIHCFSCLLGALPSVKGMTLCRSQLKRQEASGVSGFPPWGLERCICLNKRAYIIPAFGGIHPGEIPQIHGRWTHGLWHDEGHEEMIIEYFCSAISCSIFEIFKSGVHKKPHIELRK